MCATQQFTLAELAPVADVAPDDLFVILKGYFDGGNEADSTQYETVTLASLFGRTEDWRPFEAAWKVTLNKHEAPYLHTTEAVTLNNDFRVGWTASRRDAFMGDCVAVLRQSLVKAVNDDTLEPGIFPCVITIVLKDFKKAQSIPGSPQDATEVLAVQSFYRMIECSQLIKASFLYLYFDRNEPFRGHISDRLRNKRFTGDIKKDGFDIERRVAHIGESDMRAVPALQAADLLAWCVGHQDNIAFEWQKELLGIDRIQEWLDYSELSKPIAGLSDLVNNRWKFPRRRRTR